MNRETIQVFTRQVFAVPVDGGIVIAEKLHLRTIHNEEIRRRPSSYDALEEGSDDEGATKVGYCCCGCLALIWAAINIYMIIIGAVNQCPVEDHYIKVYLVVQGSFNLLHLMTCTFSICASGKAKEGVLSICLGCCNLILTLFLIAWTIAGSVWVWRSLDDWQDDHSVCNSALFISAIICLSLHYVVVLLICCCCACSIYQLCVSESSPGRELYSALKEEWNESNQQVVIYCCCGSLALIWVAVSIYLIIIGAVSYCGDLDEGDGSGISLKLYAIVQGIFNLLYLIKDTLLSLFCTSEMYEKRVHRNCIRGCETICLLFLIVWTSVGTKLVWWSLDTWEDDHGVCDSVLFISVMIYLLPMYMLLLLVFCYKFYLLYKRIAYVCKNYDRAKHEYTYGHTRYYNTFLY